MVVVTFKGKTNRVIVFRILEKRGSSTFLKFEKEKDIYTKVECK